MNLPLVGSAPRNTASTKVVGGYATILGQVSLSRMDREGNAAPITYQISDLPLSLAGTTVTLPVVDGLPLVTNPPRSAMVLLRDFPHLVGVLEAITRWHPDADGVVFTIHRIAPSEVVTSPGTGVGGAGAPAPRHTTPVNTDTATSSQEQKGTDS